MDHTDIRHKLSEYIDGSVTPDEKAAIEEHLKTCTGCADALRELRKTIEHIHTVEEVQPPAWMTSKIMAKVRAEAEEKKSFFHRLFYPLAVKLPVQAVAVLFLAFTAYYIYTSTHPAERYSEAPMLGLLQKDAGTAAPGELKQKAAELSAPRQKKAAQAPGYKSLDMKYEYERPPAPVPAEVPAAASPAKRAAPLTAKDETSHAESAAVPKAAAPSMMAEQAAPAAGNVRVREAADALSVDREADAQLAVTEHFVNVDLPERMKVKGLSYAIRRFQADLTDLQWMQRTAVYQSKPCVHRYVVDVDLSGSQSKYLYCYDSPPVMLLGIFELKNGTWSEIE